MQQTQEFVTRKVRERLAGVHPGGITLEVLDGGVYQVDKWWRVPVQPSRWPERLSDFYETLAEVTDELQAKDQVDVLFFTGSPLDEVEDEENALAAA